MARIRPAELSRLRGRHLLSTLTVALVVAVGLVACTSSNAATSSDGGRSLSVVAYSVAKPAYDALQKGFASTTGGSGVTDTLYQVDGGTAAHGTSVLIPAPSNGSNDGSHTISFQSVDAAGNIENQQSVTVHIDATPPACPTTTTR